MKKRTLQNPKSMQQQESREEEPTRKRTHGRQGIAYMTSVFVGLLATIGGMFVPNVSRGDPFVERGWDLFATVPSGTMFLGQSFKGVPLGTFDFTTGTDGDFGRGIGTLSGLGNTDTIVKRRGTADAPSETIPIELVGLQLMSVNQFDPGFGTDFYFVTLQSIPSIGTMTISFSGEGTPHGTFDSFFDVFFDLRKGSLSGPIVLSATLPLTSDDVPWIHFPPPGALEIQNVNVFLPDVSNNRFGDFWPGDGSTPGFSFAETSPTGAESHCVGAAGTVVPSGICVPEPSSMVLLALGGLACCCRRRIKDLLGNRPARPGKMPSELETPDPTIFPPAY